MYQETMDLMYHHWMQDKWRGIGWRKKHDEQKNNLHFTQKGIS